MLVHVLKENYQLKIIKNDNQLAGEEPAIRQFMYDLYFTRPVYPTILEERIKSWGTFKQLPVSDSWLLEPRRLNQWGQLAQWRMAQGQFLPATPNETQARLAQALDESITLSIPPQEKAALFLLSLTEEQFLDPLRQNEFIRQFSSDPQLLRSITNVEEQTIHFLATLVVLMDQFFQLSPEKTKEETPAGQTGKTRFFRQLMTNYDGSKIRFERSLVLTFQLTGSLALQEWIKKVVRHVLQAKGNYLVEGSKPLPYKRQITVTNRAITQANSQVVNLSTVPEEREIIQKLKGIQ